MEHLIIHQIVTVLFWCTLPLTCTGYRHNKNEAVLGAAHSSRPLRLPTTCHSFLTVMKSFIIQSLVLIGAVVVIMDAASIKPKKSILLEIIFTEANNMSEKVRGKKTVLSMCVWKWTDVNIFSVFTRGAEAGGSEPIGGIKMSGKFSVSSCCILHTGAGRPTGSSRPIQLTGPLFSQRCFFWEAEKSLNMTHFNESNLTKHLHQYNKVTRA